MQGSNKSISFWDILAPMFFCVFNNDICFAVLIMLLAIQHSLLDYNICFSIKKLLCTAQPIVLLANFRI